MTNIVVDVVVDEGLLLLIPHWLLLLLIPSWPMTIGSRTDGGLVRENKTIKDLDIQVHLAAVAAISIHTLSILN